MRNAIVAIVITVVSGTLTGVSYAHPPDNQSIQEHTTDVHQFFRNRPDLSELKEAKQTLRWHAVRAYNALIGKWDRVHQCEGAWDANTGNGYYGGLQMDWSFMSTYGGEFMDWWGTANLWPPWSQMTAAERAFQSGRGFGPWPVCGG